MSQKKLLLDQNLSYHLVRQIADVFPNAQQVGNLGLYNSNDKNIWQYAKDNDFAIVTFDADFIDFANLYGHPPKIIWLRTGNYLATHG